MQLPTHMLLLHVRASTLCLCILKASEYVVQYYNSYHFSAYRAYATPPSTEIHNVGLKLHAYTMVPQFCHSIKTSLQLITSVTCRRLK